MTNPLGRPPTYDEFNAAAAKVKQILPILGKDISGDDFEKILRAVRAGLTVQMEDEEACIEELVGHKKWLNAVKSNIDWFFWTHYEKYLRHDKNLLVADSLSAKCNRARQPIILPSARRQPTPVITLRLVNDADVLATNENLLRDSIDGLENFTKLDEKNLWRGIPKARVAELVLNFKGVTWESFQAQPISEYIMTKMDDTLWDAVPPEGVGDLYNALTVGSNDFAFNPIQRTILIADDEIKISGNNLRVGSPGTTKAGLTAEEVSLAENVFRSQERNKNKSAPETAYLIHGRRPR